MLVAENITKSFHAEGLKTEVLKSVSLAVEPGEFVSIVGRSGSGKTTLLNVLSTLLYPDSGSVRFQGRDLASLPDAKLNRLRHGDFSVVFQFHYLLPYLTALENTLLPFMHSLKPVSAERTRQAREALRLVGLEGKEGRLPNMLSGGEQQRVAIARALAKSSSILFADEPTGSLDKATGQGVMQLIRDLNKQHGLAVVMVTHDPEYAAYADRTIAMEDGRVVH